ncbi:hypothetical protein [Vibrio sinaloensis]|uniref:hypothetical protein n=1 Tax=Photobacterium sp. (strain ATCC 43367) TaxID=379097 RepID=UPI002F3EB570
MIRKLYTGGYGLPITFWGFYFVGLIPVRAVQNINDNIPLGFALLFTEIVLEILVIMGIWNLRSKYEGAKAWIWISLVLVVLSLFVAILALGSMVVYLATA